MRMKERKEERKSGSSAVFKASASWISKSELVSSGFHYSC